MADETTNEQGADVLPFSKAKQTRRSRKVTGRTPAKATTPAKAAKATKATKSAKKTTAKKASASGIVRKPSTVSKEGTQKDAFTGEVLPVTAFPTVRNKDGQQVRGTVARKNLEAYRAARKAQRAADKAKAEAEKAAAKKAAAEAKAKAAKETATTS